MNRQLSYVSIEDATLSSIKSNVVFIAQSSVVKVDAANMAWNYVLSFLFTVYYDEHRSTSTPRKHHVDPQVERNRAVEMIQEKFKRELTDLTNDRKKIVLLYP